ncbi:methyltransferase domain-containing protein [Beijerinckia mobilis]|uniref:methyltransferase domain-containing protein n=1 Tax=Beijerinckia mobilis TaxID=231434 RepID=UPI00068C2EBB|nr:methyltransferase domain-containing protein [Beijerinckia mobilis]
MSTVAIGQSFPLPHFAYTAADIHAGPGVHIVCENPYRLPLDDRSIDIVLSGQMLEHCEFFWLVFAEMIRVLRPGGFLFLIAPSAGPQHRYPVDCYRFYPDAYRALARYANCCLLDVWMDERGPWRDLVGVFQRHGAPPSAASLPAQTVLAPETIPPASPEEERVQGDTSYLSVLKELHEAISPRCYLEIGVRHGNSLRLAKGAAVGVDPAPALAEPLSDSIQLIKSTSDAFFDGLTADDLPGPVDFAFIDGLHHVDAALRDFMHIERIAAPDAIIAIDDILPNHTTQADRNRRSRVWTGDVWKLTEILRRYRPDLTLAPLNTSPSGCLLIAGLDPQNHILWDLYNPILREVSSWHEVPEEILQRRGVFSPQSKSWRAFIDALTSGIGGHSRTEALRQLTTQTA